jgi:radical SAM enzyme (TIGR01210 family)
MMEVLPSIYPAESNDRDRWILERRPPRAAVDPYLPYAFLLEHECSASGELQSVATIFLSNRECPWKCLMCDLWKNTTRETVPVGAIPAQVEHALARLKPARQIKLYNSGSFFDPKAIPIEDYSAIASLLDSYDQVIVECHPALLGSSCQRFRDLLKGRLEVAMGLETVHPETLSRLNKRMTARQFKDGAQWLAENDISLRVFVLIKPPFLPETEAAYWAEKSIDFAFDCGASVVSLIPTRAGNGAMDELGQNGEFTPPSLDALEAAVTYGLSLKRGRVFADIWDLERISACRFCYQQRKDRLMQLNFHQEILSPVTCAFCGAN